MAKEYKHEKWFTVDNKRYVVRADTQRELGYKEAEKRRDLAEGKQKLTGNMTVRQWGKQWLEVYKEPVVGARWLKNIRSQLEVHIYPSIGKLPLRQVKPLHIQKLMRSCQHLSEGYIAKIYNVVNEMFNDARKNKLIYENPAEDLTIPKGKPEESRRALTASERTGIVNAAQNYQGGPFFLCMLYCGLRPGETAALTWNCVDLKKMELKVTQAVKAEGIVGETKTGSGLRTVPIPEEFAEILKALMPSPADPFGYVFRQASGRRHTATSISQKWKTLTRRANIALGCKTFKGKVLPPYRLDPELTPYYLRHTYCTDLQAAGVPIDVARRLMGHASIATTSKIYTHESTEAMQDAKDSLNNLYKNRSGVAVGVAVKTPKEG